MKKLPFLLICLFLAVGLTVSRAAKPESRPHAIGKSKEAKSTAKNATAKEGDEDDGGGDTDDGGDDDDDGGDDGGDDGD